jgi:hypothetical protein
MTMNFIDAVDAAHATARQEPVRLWPEPWASSAKSEADNLQGQLWHALPEADLSPADEATRDTVLKLLANARAATDLGQRKRPSLQDRWRGTSVERAHYYLHGAKVALVDVLPADEIHALIPTAAARLGTCLPATDIRRIDVERLLAPLAADAPQMPLSRQRAILKRALQVGYEASDQLYARIRGFRNLLLVVAATIFVFMAVLVSVVSLKPTSVPFCFSPPITAPVSNAQPALGTTSGEILVRAVCPSGHDPARGVPVARTPQPRDISIVAGLGMIGGALAAAVAIRNVRGTSTPYDVPLALALLKVPTGALTAVSGILLLGGGFVPGFSELDSQSQILAYALVLGYAQQLVTQLIDKQAMTVLNAVPSKDATGKQPTQTAVVSKFGGLVASREPSTT